MAGKARVHELAKELGVTTKDILARLNAQGEIVKSGSSTLSAPVARRVRESYRLRDEEKPASLAAVQEPPHVYVRDRTSFAAHHRDYLNDRSDEALCGHKYVDPIAVGETGRPSDVCPACDARVSEYHARWWRDQYRAANSELEALRANYRKLKEHSDHQRTKLSELQNRAHPVKQTQKQTSVQKAQQRRQKLGQQKRKPGSAEAANAQQRSKPVARQAVSRLGIPVVSRQQIAEREARRRVTEPDEVRKKAKKVHTPERRRPKTQAEKASDDAARESMRSYKPSSWRLGRSPGSYG
jgi:hypothetical protein